MRILLDFTHPRGDVKMVRINGETWALHGECSRCGVCCDKLKMPLPELADEDRRCIKFSYQTINGERVGKCAIRETRPAFCMLYPRDPYEPLYSECSYKWEKLSG